MPLGLGWPELALILLIVIIIFGVGKLPEIGQALGRGINEFRSASREADESKNGVVKDRGQAEAPREDIS
jgi:sec-independent protein translocase protein TatA